MCERCGEVMYQIGPFAKGHKDGEEPERFDGIFRYQCTNSDCPDLEKIIEVTPEDRVNLAEAMQQICQCDHARVMHGYSLAGTPNDGRTYGERKDKECSGTECTCGTFTPKE